MIIADTQKMWEESDIVKIEHWTDVCWSRQMVVHFNLQKYKLLHMC